MKNNAAIPASNLMGGSSEYSYEYDDLYRLTKAQGSFKGSNAQHTYNLSMSYNSVGGITQKTQVHKSKDQEQKKTTYDLNYTYGDTQPHAPVHIGEQTYTYDPNGNQLGWTDDKTGQRRDIMWDEENRIRSIYDNGSQHHYIYDAAGERVLKGKSTGQRIFVNGEWKAGSGGMGNYTVYVNPYLVLRSGGYSKHYYIEGQRIVSKLGGGWDNTKNEKAGGDKVDYNGKTQRVFDGIVKNLKFLGADGQILTAGKSGKIPPGQLNGTATGNVNEAFRYFYHPDLPIAIGMGSTSYVTDASGEVYQHLEYFAFGETFFEEHSNTDRTPYLFNGKELDEETGLYYYGARYYDARTSVWQSVDPKADKYPSISSYAYTFNNPITFFDPDGKEGIVVSGQPGPHANKQHFLANGLDRAQKAMGKIKTEGEKVTWIVYNDGTKFGHDKKMLAEYKAKAEALGINVKVVGSSEEIVNYVNQKNGGDSRQKDKISSFYYVGHATPGDLEVGYQDKSNDYIEPSDFDSDAFASGSWINLVGGCRTAVDGDVLFEKSAVDQFVELVDKKSTVHGSNVRVQYDGGVQSDSKILEVNKGKIITKKGSLDD